MKQLCRFIVAAQAPEHLAVVGHHDGIVRIHGAGDFEIHAGAVIDFLLAVGGADIAVAGDERRVDGNCLAKQGQRLGKTPLYEILQPGPVFLKFGIDLGPGRILGLRLRRIAPVLVVGDDQTHCVAVFQGIVGNVRPELGQRLVVVGKDCHPRRERQHLQADRQQEHRDRSPVQRPHDGVDSSNRQRHTHKSEQVPVAGQADLGIKDRGGKQRTATIEQGKRYRRSRQGTTGAGHRPANQEHQQRRHQQNNKIGQVGHMCNGEQRVPIDGETIRHNRQQRQSQRQIIRR